MEKLQVEIAEWQRDTFKSSDDVAKYNHLVKEIIELKDAISSGNKDEIAMEIADCCFLLYGIASLNQIDVIEAMNKKFEINKKRKWGKPDKNGVVEHIEENRPSMAESQN